MNHYLLVGLVTRAQHVLPGPRWCQNAFGKAQRPLSNHPGPTNQSIGFHGSCGLCAQTYPSFQCWRTYANGVLHPAIGRCQSWSPPQNKVIFLPLLQVCILAASALECLIGLDRIFYLTAVKICCYYSSCISSNYFLILYFCATFLTINLKYWRKFLF